MNERTTIKAWGALALLALSMVGCGSSSSSDEPPLKGEPPKVIPYDPSIKAPGARDVGSEEPK